MTGPQKEEGKEQPKRRPKAYSYVRFSFKRQAKGDSLLRQLDRSRLYAAEHGLDLQEFTYEDLGVSAFDRTNMTSGALAAFIKAAEEGVVERGSYLLVESLDRLSRAQAIVAMELLAKLVGLGIRVVTVIDGRVLDEDSIKTTDALLYAVLVFIRANEESEVKSDRVKKAHARKRVSGSKFVFGQGPGWLKPNAARDGWEVVPELAASVVKVFEYSAKGFGCTAIARIANRESWPVPGRAEDWHVTLPHKLVHNRRVLGEFEPALKEGRSRRATGEVWETYYPAIVTPELFAAANAAVARRRTLPKRRDNGYHGIFQGLLKCGNCGATLARKAKTGPKNSPGYALYVCTNHLRGKESCPSWSSRNLEPALIPPLMSFVTADTLESSVRQKARTDLEVERNGLEQDQQAAERLLATVERMGGSEMVEKRLKVTEQRIGVRVKRIAELSVIVKDPKVAVWEEDLEAAIASTLRAARDITDEFAAEREAFHQSLLRVVDEVKVWPRSHATVTLKGEAQVTLLPLSVNMPAFVHDSAGFSVMVPPT